MNVVANVLVNVLAADKKTEFTSWEFGCKKTEFPADGTLLVGNGKTVFKGNPDWFPGAMTACPGPVNLFNWVVAVGGSNRLTEKEGIKFSRRPSRLEQFD